MVGSITATAVFVESLPTPPQLLVARPPPSMHDDHMVLALANRVEQIGAVNRQRLQVYFGRSVLRPLGHCTRSFEVRCSTKCHHVFQCLCVSMLVWFMYRCHRFSARCYAS